MPDEIDAAQDHIEKTLAATLALHRVIRPAMPACGQCYNCGESLGDGERFCDADCVQDYELRKRHGKC